MPIIIKKWKHWKYFLRSHKFDYYLPPGIDEQFLEY